PRDSLDEVVCRLACDGGVARLQRQTELVDETEVGSVELTHDLATELDRPPVVDAELLDATADSVSCLEHRDVGSAAGQGPRGPGAQHENVAQGLVSSRCRLPTRTSRAESRSSSPR